MSKYRDFLVGEENAIPSRAEYKVALLRSGLAVIAFVVSIGYIFLDRFFGVHGTEPYYLMVAVLSVLTFLLNRAGLFMHASMLFLILINLFVFYFSAIDPYQSGVLMYFIVTGLMAYALLGYKHIKLSMLFVIFSMLLFTISFCNKVPFIVRREYTDLYLKFSFATNFIATLVGSSAIMYFLMDINHQSEGEILEKNEQLEKANEELDRFVYSASHDLKAPLSSIRGLVDIARRTTTNGETNQLLKMIEERIDHLNRFIGDIIHYSRNSRTSVLPDQVDLAELSKSIVDDLRFIEGAEDIRIELDVRDQLVLKTDPARVKLILNNLISNAIRHHDESKADRYIRISVVEEKGICTVTVVDNGRGISAEHGNKIFDMFYRASERSTGSGIGLYIVRETVAKLRGNIEFSSEEGKGSTFVVTLPNSA